MVHTTKQHSGYFPILYKQLGEHVVRKEWVNFRCPFHHGESFNFGVNTNTGVYSCFVCGVKGHIRDLLKDKRNIGSCLVGNGDGFVHRGGILGMTEDTSSAAARGSDGISKHTNSNLNNLNLTPNIFVHMFNRITSEPNTISESMAYDYVVGRKVDIHAYECGILEHPDYGNRIIFPFRKNGVVVYFQGRAYTNIFMKTKNPPEGVWPKKGDVLWNYDNIRDNVFICEGIFDAMGVEKAGFSATCLLGKTISDNQIKLLRDKKIEKVNIFLDNDANAQAVQLALKLYDRKFKTDVIIWQNDNKKEDPGSITTTEVKDLISTRRLTLDHLLAVKIRSGLF